MRGIAWDKSSYEVTFQVKQAIIQTILVSELQYGQALTSDSGGVFLFRLYIKSPKGLGTELPSPILWGDRSAVTRAGRCRESFNVAKHFNLSQLSHCLTRKILNWNNFFTIHFLIYIYIVLLLNTFYSVLLFENPKYIITWPIVEWNTKLNCEKW